MPRYSFNVFDGDTTVDTESMQLAGVREARRESLRLAAEVLQHEGIQAFSNREWRIETTGSDGLILFRIDILLSHSPAVHSH